MRLLWRFGPNRYLSVASVLILRYSPFDVGASAKLFRMALEFTTSYIEDSLGVFRYYKKLAERAMEQVTDEQLFEVLDSEANSIAIIVKHMTGNMRSRWTDFLTSDGEKPNRNRDSEFVDPPATRAALLSEWEDGWSRLFGAIEPLTDADLGRRITIRGEAHSVMQAINRQLAHYPHHVGQIVLLAKHFACDRWQSLSVPRNKSGEFNRKVAAGEASQR
jgi:Protein of unknown function (DUF1572)